MDTEPAITPSPSNPEAANTPTLDVAYIQLRFAPEHREKVFEAIELLAERVGALATNNETTVAEHDHLEPGTDLSSMLAQTFANQELERRQASFKLSDREQRVMECFLEGLSIAEAAARLFVSKETVKSQLQSIREKLGNMPGEKHAVIAEYNGRYRGPRVPRYRNRPEQ